MKTIRTRYPGTCSSCGERIERGQLAVWDPRTRTIAHDSGAVACAARMKDRGPDEFDMAAEDRMAEACGLSPFDRSY